MLGFIKNWFTPHKGNNHRAKIIHNISLSAIVILILVSSISLNFVKTTHPEVLGVSYSITESELFTDVNAERIKNGLEPLRINPELSDAARRKASDMFAKNYWAHFSPDGSSTPWQFIRDSGYDYQFAGENLAKGFTDSGSVVNAWMNSPSHRENLLSNHYQDVGYAIVPGTLQGEETVLIVQMFGETPDEALAGLPKITTEATQTENAVPAAPQAVQVTQAPQQAPSVKSTTTEVVKTPVVNSRTTSKILLSVVLIFIVFGFVMDGLIVERKKIPRIVGHNLDHIILILTFVLFLVIMKGGVIL